MNLDSEKRNRIINAALKEFAQKGYKNASTNEIVKNAEISKGLLFHYFTNKKSLFLFLLDYSSNIFINEFFSKFNCEKTDIITRWKKIVILKIELIRKYPEMYDFNLTTLTDDSIEFKQEIESKYKGILEDSYKRVLANIDTSVFKEGLDVKRVSEIIVWAVQGFSNNELEKLKHNPSSKLNYDLNAITKDFDEYIELLKNAFYK
jgi:AcrR family transcriptional regulator